MYGDLVREHRFERVTLHSQLAVQMSTMSAFSLSRMILIILITYTTPLYPGLSGDAKQLIFHFCQYIKEISYVV